MRWWEWYLTADDVAPAIAPMHVAVFPFTVSSLHGDPLAKCGFKHGQLSRAPVRQTSSRSLTLSLYSLSLAAIVLAPTPASFAQHPIRPRDSDAPFPTRHDRLACSHTADLSPQPALGSQRQPLERPKHANSLLALRLTQHGQLCRCRNADSAVGLDTG